MNNYKAIFLAMFINIQKIEYPSPIKTGKHWNNGFNKKDRSGVYHANHKEKSHLW